jgi:hypothetical protein
MRKNPWMKLYTLTLSVFAALAFGCDDPAGVVTILTTDDYVVSDVTGVYAVDTITAGEEQLQEDDNTVAYSMPFDFPFYGVDYGTVYGSTNGHVWFGSDDGSYDEVLEDYITPVVAGWNDDLDSDSFGEGLRIQSFTNPDRVVFDWDTETHSQVGENILNRFQIVLYATGEIVIHYLAFDPGVGCFDYGSGLNDNDVDTLINLTDILDIEVCRLGGRSYSFVPVAP